MKNNVSLAEERMNCL